MEILINIFVYLLVVLVFVIVCDVWFSFSCWLVDVFRKRKHPDRCPLCKLDIEHSKVCFDCPFVVIDEWYECADCSFGHPISGHCGLKDKEFYERVKYLSEKDKEFYDNVVIDEFWSLWT